MTFNSIRDFSHECVNAWTRAVDMVLYNRANRNPDIDHRELIIRGLDGQWWIVAWTYAPTTGDVIVCWWSCVRAPEIREGTVFGTHIDRSSRALAAPDGMGNFDAVDDEGVTCTFSTNMVQTVVPE